MISPRRLAIACLGAVLVWQGGWSVAAMVAHDAIYDHRLFNVRKLTGPSPENFISAAAHFIGSEADPSKPTIVFAGSSVTFGYSFSEQAIFSHHIAENLPGATVLNLSVVGIGTRYMIRSLLCLLEIEPVRIDTLVLEIAVVNDASAAVQRSKPPNVECDPFWSALPIFAKKQLGLRWISKISDEYRDNFDPRPVILNALPESYIPNATIYSKAAGALSRDRRDKIAKLRDRVGHLIVFPSPVYVDGLERLGFDRANVERQITDALNDCLAVERVTCLDTRVFSSAAEMFINVTHLGLEGHDHFADWLLGQQQLQAESGADRRVGEDQVEIGLRQSR